MDLSTAGRRLSTLVADHRGPGADAPTPQRAAPVGLVHAVLVDGCAALDHVAELPALARQNVGSARLGTDLLAQADAVASVAAHLAVVLRSDGPGFRGDLGAARGDLAARSGLASLGPDETDTSLILAAENISQALSLAARVVLVLARLRARRRRARRLASMRRGPATQAARWVSRWVARIASLPLATGIADLWPFARTHPAAVAVAAAFAVLVVSVGRRARPHTVGPLGTALGVLGELAADVVGVVASVLMPHAMPLVLALVDLVTGTRGTRRHRPTERGKAGCVGFTNDRPRPRRARREHRERRDE